MQMLILYYSSKLYHFMYHEWEYTSKSKIFLLTFPAVLIVVFVSSAGQNDEFLGFFPAPVHKAKVLHKCSACLSNSQFHTRDLAFQLRLSVYSHSNQVKKKKRQNYLSKLTCDTSIAQKTLTFLLSKTLPYTLPLCLSFSSPLLFFPSLHPLLSYSASQRYLD